MSNNTNNISKQKDFKFPIDDPSWSSNIQQYQHSKTHLPWSKNPTQQYITHKDMYQRDHHFDAILQKYTNQEQDKEIFSKENSLLKRSISQFYDKSLRYQQTYDIINLKDKFKGFENHPDYPFPKAIPNDKINPSLTNTRSFNILSNKNLYEHNNIPYEKRPSLTTKDNLIKTLPTKATNFKDYNIISNKYKEHNKEKEELDKQIAYLTATDKINKRKDFNFLQNKYFSQQLQEEIEHKEKNKQELNIINKIPYKGQLYNPINMSVYDKDNLMLKDSKEYNKINRYRIKKDIDNYYRRQDFEKGLKKEELNNNKIDYKRYEINDKRGYDLFTFGDTYNHYKDNFKFKNNLSCWDLLKQGKGKNETFTKKGIYKDKYDISDIDDNLYKFKNNRNEELKKLKPISQEEKFKLEKHREKINDDVKKLNKNYDEKIQKQNIEFNKENWFAINKNVNM